jgi:hypothetical protein
MYHDSGLCIASYIFRQYVKKSLSIYFLPYIHFYANNALWIKSCNVQNRPIYY